MLEKMQLLYIMGSMDDIDRAIKEYISLHEIQLEYALKEIADSHDMESCLTENPYAVHTAKAEKFIQELTQPVIWTEVPEADAIKIIDEAHDFFERRADYFRVFEAKQSAIQKLIDDIEPFKTMNVDMPSLRSLEFIEFQFGRMPIVNFKQFEVYIHDKEDIIFLEGRRDKSYVYGLYFVLSFGSDKIDTMLTSLNFEKVSVPFEYEDHVFLASPAKAYELMIDELEACKKEIRRKHNETLYTFGINAQDVSNAYNSLKKRAELYDFRKYAAKTVNDYYVFVGWSTEKEAMHLKQAMEHDDKIILMDEEPGSAKSTTPPTSLRNNFFVRPFEFFVKAYGLPKYGEIDPTPFVAATYFVLFGMMFGDLGQGAVLCVAGYLLYRLKGLELGKILGFVGASSMFFGLMYGSVFGLEHVLPTIWMKPAENVNSILLTTIICGVALIFVSMLLNMTNAIKQSDKARLLFGPNGAAGMIFYAGVLTIIADFVYGSGRLGRILALPFVIMPLMLIAFRVQIEAYLKTKRLNIDRGVPMFVLETAIEAFEILLTYFTNTVSFVRIGAFALSHAGMMSVVLLLAQRGSSLSLPVMIMGNLLVILMEGLVVGIQVLRIEFYELFSRYYEGGGREFNPSGKKIQQRSA